MEAGKQDKKVTVEVKPILTEIRKERGLTGIRLSEIASVPQPAISRFDSSQQYDIKNLFLIARALNCKIDDLFEAKFTDE